MDKGKGPALPGELQISIFEHMIAQQCPVITLRDQAHLDKIIATLIDVSNIKDKASDNIHAMVENAIWTTAVIRPNIN